MIDKLTDLEIRMDDKMTRLEQLEEKLLKKYGDEGKI